MGPIELFEHIKKIPGAVSITEMVALYDTIRKNIQCRDRLTVALDLGSHAGKSSCAGSAALSSLGRYDIFLMIDPVYDLGNDEAWKRTVQGSADKMPWGHVREEGFKKRVLENVQKHSSLLHRMYGTYSLHMLEDAANVSYVFIDSDDHQPELVSQEVAKLEDRVLPGGLIFFHDFNNQYHGPRMAYNWLVQRGKYEPIGIDCPSAIQFVQENNLEDGNDSWHMPGEKYPCYIGCVRRKQ